MIAIIDYGSGNLRSVTRAVASVGAEVMITSSAKAIRAADGVILPGVGAAADIMNSLKALELTEVVREVIAAKRPFLGVCMGLQALLSVSEEAGRHPCLNIIPGTVRKLPDGLKVPHMGWNQVKQQRAHPIFQGIPDESNFYFVHSYYVDPTDWEVVAATTEYGIQFASIITRDSLVATQFHPEKSGKWGLQFYRNFVEMVAKVAV